MLMYGDLTANGSAGGRAGEKVDDPAACTVDTKEATRRPKRRSCIVHGRSQLRRELDAFIADSKQGGDHFQRERRSTFVGMLDEDFIQGPQAKATVPRTSVRVVSQTRRLHDKDMSSDQSVNRPGSQSPYGI